MTGLEVTADRRVLLIDLDAFFTSVEELMNPSLRGVPLIVGGKPEHRGVVAAASYAIRNYGVHSAMPVRRALQLCPHAVLRPPNHQEYREHSCRIMELLRCFSPRIQQVSIDEAYLELDRNIPFSSAIEMGNEIKKQVYVEAGLTCSVGLATNKLVAKVACESAKPNGFQAVFPGEEETFLASFPVTRLPGVGPRTQDKLAGWGISTVKQLAEEPVERLLRSFGKRGVQLWERAHGVDLDPLTMEREPKSLSTEETFAEDTNDLVVVRGRLSQMCQGLAAILGKERVRARTVSVKLRFSDFTTLTRSFTRRRSTDDAEELYGEALRLLGRIWDSERLVRLIGVRGEKLVYLDQTKGAMQRLL